MTTDSQVYSFKQDKYSSHSQISEWIKLLKLRNVLDIGCAGGFLFKALGNKWEGELVGIEKEASWVNTDDVKKYKKIFWLDLEKKNIYKTLGKKVSYYDAIVTADVLEHLDNPNKTLEEIKKIMNYKGYLMVSLPNINYLPVLIIRLIFPNLRMSKGPLDKTHKHFYSLDGAKKLLEINEFKIIKTQVTPPPLWVIFQRFKNIPFLKLIYDLSYNLAVLIPSIFAYQILFLAQPRKKIFR